MRLPPAFTHLENSAGTDGSDGSAHTFLHRVLRRSAVMPVFPSGSFGKNANGEMWLNLNAPEDVM